MIPAIIPFYKNHEQLRLCIQNLERQTSKVELFIRDNSDDNVYFTAAINEGLLRFLNEPCEYMLIINQDMYLAKDAVEKLVEFMDEHPRCGIATPLQLLASNPQQVIYAGAKEAFPGGVHVEGTIDQFSEPMQTYWANGACMLLRKQMIHEIGFFDPNLKMIGSDSDYSFTARSRGWEVWVVPEARGLHETGASQPSEDPKLELIKIDDVIYFCGKWLSGDVYRSLAFEGKMLGPESVDWIRKQILEAREQKLSRLSPSA